MANIQYAKIIHEIHELNIAFNKSDNGSRDKIIKQYKTSIYELLHKCTLNKKWELNKDERFNINKVIGEIQDKIFDDMNLYKKFKEEGGGMLVDFLNDIRLETNDHLKVILQAKEERKKTEKSASDKKVVVKAKKTEAKAFKKTKLEPIEEIKPKAVIIEPLMTSEEEGRRERRKTTNVPKKKKISASEFKEKAEAEDTATKENKENIFNEKKIDEMKDMMIEKLNQLKSLINSYISKHNIVEKVSEGQQRITNGKEKILGELQDYFNKNKDEIIKELSRDINLLKLKGDATTHLKQKLIHEITTGLSVYSKLSTEHIRVAIVQGFFLGDIDTLIEKLEK